MKKILFSIFFLLAIVPAMASDGTKFTVFGQVSDTDGTPLNGVTVVLSVSGSSLNAITENVTLINGNNASGYYVLELANLPAGANDTPIYVNEGTSMTITATTTGKSASWTGPRAASEPQEVNLRLSTGSTGGGSGGSTTSGGGGGGGGGGGTSGENFSNILAKESREEFIAKDLPATYNFITPSFPVYMIVIIGNLNAGLTNTQIELLKNRSSLVREDAPEKVYKYLNIWVGTSGFATPKNIKDATIRFRVENSWLESGGFKDADVVMFRWDGTKWLSLETQLNKIEGDFTHFDAKTNAFSPFAISAIKGGLPGATPQITPAISTDTATPTASPELPSTSSNKIFIILSIIILLGIAAYIYNKNIRKK